MVPTGLWHPNDTTLRVVELLQILFSIFGAFFPFSTLFQVFSKLEEHKKTWFKHPTIQIFIIARHCKTIHCLSCILPHLYITSIPWPLCTAPHNIII